MEGAVALGLFTLFIFIIQIVFSLLFFGISIACLVFTILAIIDITKRSDQWPDRTLWIVLVLLAPFCQFVYWFHIRKQIDAKYPVINQPPTPPAPQPPVK